MRHMLGDYYSNIDPIPALIIAAILVIILILMILWQIRKDNIKKAIAENTAPTRTRATYVAAQNQAIFDYQEVEDAITRTRP